MIARRVALGLAAQSSPAALRAWYRLQARGVSPLVRAQLVDLLAGEPEVDPGAARWLTDEALLAIADRAIREGRLVVHDATATAARSVDEAVATRAMAGQEAIVHRGQRLALRTPQGWTRVRRGGHAHVVRLREAREIVEGLAAQPGTPAAQAAALRQAGALLKDRIDQGDERGLLLVRFEVRRAAAAPDEVPPVTPSRMRRDEEAPLLVTIELERLYHDDEPLHRAPFELEAADGRVVRGTLDDAGTATVRDLPEGPMRVRFGPDARPYAAVDQRKNPEFAESFGDAAAEALVSRYVT